METINIQFTLFSAFYSPLISTFSAGFLQEEGLDPQWSVSPPGVSAIAALEDGSAHVVQSALSQGFAPLSKGELPSVVHFAQINEMDGFFVSARDADPDFNWDKLEGAEVVTFPGGQPLAMFKYDKAFRGGTGDYVQQQGPFPQQLEADGVGSIVAQSGPLIGPVGFSSLAARPEWLKTDMAERFMRAYRKTRIYMNEKPAAEIAAAEKPYFPNIDEAVLSRCIASYQELGTWTPHVEITPSVFEVVLDVFEHFGTLSERYRWEQVCVNPPGS